MYHFLLFDADNTLLDFSKTESEALVRLFQDFSLPLDENTRKTYITLNQSLWQQHERGEISRQTILDTRFDRLFAALQVNRDGHKAEQIYRSYLNEGSFVIEGARELLASLSADYALYLVTNGTALTQQKRLSASGLLPYFRDCFISELVGAQKPSSLFFDYVKAHIPGFSADKALVIGDSLTSDILGALNAGIDSCYFNPSYQNFPPEIKPTYQIHSLSELPELLRAPAEWRNQ